MKNFFKPFLAALLVFFAAAICLVSCEAKNKKQKEEPADTARTDNPGSRMSATGTKCDCDTLYKGKKNGDQLISICKYIIEKNIPAPLDPCNLSIISITEMSMEERRVYDIMLSCCYTGDNFVLDRMSNQVVSYAPGDE